MRAGNAFPEARFNLGQALRQADSTLHAALLVLPPRLAEVDLVEPRELLGGGERRAISG